MIDFRIHGVLPFQVTLSVPPQVVARLLPNFAPKTRRQKVFLLLEIYCFSGKNFTF
jgi:hypothetical protein